MQLEPDEMTAIINRAKRAQGHFGKVIAMMEQGAACEDVLTQLAAVNRAIGRTGYALVATGLHQCVAAGDGPDSAEVKKMEKLFLGLA